MQIKKSWIVCCFLNFLMASFMGLIMRFVYLFPLQYINYGFLLHAHSHAAMLGWVYLMIYVLIVHFFISKEKSEKPVYSRLFWFTEFSVIGMMISFPIQGYALFSIVFSTLHILLSYVFCWLVWRDSNKNKTGSKLLLSAAILFMVLSTFGVWCLGPAIGILGKQSNMYQIAIQFFLHFQFNGWFLAAVLALFLKQFKEKIERRTFQIFFWLFVSAVFLTFAFPVNWYFKCSMLNWINTLGLLVQLAAFFYFYKMLKPQIFDFKSGLDNASKLVYGLAVSSLFLKISIQLLIIVPYFAEASHQIRNLVIGFVHLTTLGVLSGFLFGILIQNKILLQQSNLLLSGIKCFIAGYFITEVLLFVQGAFFCFNAGTFFGYYESIFSASVFIVIGLMLITISFIKKQESIN